MRRDFPAHVIGAFRITNPGRNIMGLLDNRIALVTGAGQGVGQGIAFALAAYPAPGQKSSKYWPPVARVDNVYGDRNLFCSCIPVTEAEAEVTASATAGA